VVGFPILIAERLSWASGGSGLVMTMMTMKIKYSMNKGEQLYGTMKTHPRNL
jgi:hypothetical protein